MKEIFRFVCIFSALVASSFSAFSQNAVALKPVNIKGEIISVIRTKVEQPDNLKQFREKAVYVKYVLNFGKPKNLGFNKQVKLVVAEAVALCESKNLIIGAEFFLDEKMASIQSKVYAPEDLRHLWLEVSDDVKNEIINRVLTYECRNQSRDTPEITIDCEGDVNGEVNRFEINFNAGSILLNERDNLLDPKISETDFTGRLEFSKYNVLFKISRINGRVIGNDLNSDTDVFKGECKKSSKNKF